MFFIVCYFEEYLDKVLFLEFLVLQNVIFYLYFNIVEDKE